MNTLYPIDIPVAVVIATLAENAIAAVNEAVATLSAPSAEALEEALRLSIMGEFPYTVWWDKSRECWRPSQQEMETFAGLRGIARRAITNQLFTIRGEDGIGECPVGANPDGVVWFYEVLSDASEDVVSAHFGDTRPGVQPIERIAEAARALDAIVSLGIRPAASHREAVAELRRVGLDTLAGLADGAVGYAPV
jgi:hypothetical protein